VLGNAMHELMTLKGKVAAAAKVLVEKYHIAMQQPGVFNAEYEDAHKKATDLWDQLRQRALVAQEATNELGTRARAFWACRRLSLGAPPGNSCTARFEEYDKMGMDAVSKDDVMDDEINMMENITAAGVTELADSSCTNVGNVMTTTSTVRAELACQLQWVFAKVLEMLRKSRELLANYVPYMKQYGGTTDEFCEQVPTCKGFRQNMTRIRADVTNDIIAVQRLGGIPSIPPSPLVSILSPYLHPPKLRLRVASILQVDILAKVLSFPELPKKSAREKNISGHWDRLLAQIFDARLVGIAVWTDCPLFHKSTGRTSN